ncbi:anti-sigma factor [Bacteroidia bacterium]|nr:anti-sigma factor [Bacteroidia bacterium]
MENVSSHIKEIIESLLSGTASDEEADQLRAWVNESANNRAILNKHRKIHLLTQMYSKQKNFDLEAAWQKLKILLPELQPQATKWSLTWFYRVAAIFVLSFSAGMGAMYFSMKPTPTPLAAVETEQAEFFTEYTVPYGSKAKVVLPDSSNIWMNAGSTLRYGSKFNQQERNVYIEGEAYFKVTKNAAKPFYVNTSTITLKVLGTSFNVKAYPEEKQIETTVESGTVQLLSAYEGKQAEKLLLVAGQKMIVPKDASNPQLEELPPSPAETMVAHTDYKPKDDEKITITENVITELYTSWKEERWLLEKEPLASLAVKLGRRFNVQIVFTDESLKNYSFSGTLNDETLEQVLDIIKLSSPIDFKVKKNKVTLFRNKWITK